MELAIVIPAYKKQFLEAALYSISQQTDKDFTVYIGDDNSPEDLLPIIEKFSNDLRILYQKFEENWGRLSLTRHWDRCIALTHNEEWIWLFSDDDRMDCNCVARFKETLFTTQESYHLYRFNTKIINADGEIVQHNALHPQVESSYQFALDRLELKRNSYVVEYIFSKQQYLKIGKFVSFPLAWSSDEATWINIGRDNGIFTITDAFVYWRYSFTNISSLTNLDKEKIKATLQYLSWLSVWAGGQEKSYLTDQFEKAKLTWLKHQLNILNKSFGFLECCRLSLLFKKRLAIPLRTSLSFLLRLNIGIAKRKLKTEIRLALKIN